MLKVLLNLRLSVSVSTKCNELLKFINLSTKRDAVWSENGRNYFASVSDEIKKALDAEVDAVSLLKEQQEK